MSGKINMQAIYKTISDNDINTFRELLSNVAEAGPLLQKVVRFASEQGFVDGLRFLIKEKGVGCLELQDSQNSFHIACEFGQVEVVKLLLSLEEFDKKVTVMNSNFEDGLSIASEKNNEEVIRVLLSSGKFDINKVPPHGVSRLFYAIEKGKKQLAVELIQHGAELTFVGQSKGVGSISCMCLSAVKMPSILPDLLKHGGNVNDVHERSGKSVLMLAIGHKADRNTIEQLVRAGANLKWADKSGRTAFSVLKSIDQLHGVLDADIPVEDIENRYKFSILSFILTRQKRPEKGDILHFLEKGANPNFFKDGEPSLLTLAYKNRFRTEEDIRILLQHGANPQHIDHLGFTVLQNIVNDLKYGAAHLLLEFGAKPDHVLEKLMYRPSDEDEWIKLGRRILECGADPNELSGRQPLLSVAIEGNLFSLSEELVKHGANVNVVDDTFRSPLNYACQLGMKDKDFRCLRMLLNYPTNLRMYNFNNHTDALEKTAIEQSVGTSYINQHTITIDVRGVFHLFIAGVDLINKHRSDFSLGCLASRGLFESIKCLMRCGWDISGQRAWLTDLENGEFVESRFVIRECVWGPQIAKDEIESLTAVLNEIESEPKSLQNLCRRKIRGELASFGQSILPLIEDLPIPGKLKSFMKFEECEFLKEEIVTLKFHRMNSNYFDSDEYNNHYDYDYDTDDFLDYYSDNDYERGDHKEMYFNIETDEFEPIWW